MLGSQREAGVLASNVELCVFLTFKSVFER